ncbi:MAG: alpha-amylase family glycosyl hydrolase [Bacteroidota bacterium]
MKISHYSFIFLFALFLFSCSQKAEQVFEKAPTTSSKWPNAVTYEIFVQSFNDSNGDGIGDFKGMTDKVEYLQELGVGAVWLMPIMPSPSYHKYDVTNYRDVHSDYGTMDDFKTFVRKAHEANIKVVIDLVINHSSAEHTWFLKSKANDPDYREYYVWADKDSVAEQISKKSITGDSDNIRQWHAPDGDITAEHYYGFFWGGMPDLNFDSDKLRAEIYDIGRFWLDDVGVDGFRLDAAKHIFPDERAADNHAFWIEFKEEMQKVKPDVYLIGEVWASTDISSPYTKGLQALFNFDLAFSIIESLNSEKSKSTIVSGPSWKVLDSVSLVSGFIKNQNAFKSYNPDFINATFLSNHDQNRVASMLNNDQDKIKLAASILLTLPGAPYLYYGEELGMLGMKPDEQIREPFLWTAIEKDKGRATWVESKYSTDDSIGPLSIQSGNPESIFNHYKTLINLRKASDVLTLGDIKEMPVSAGIVSFTRGLGGNDVWILHNISSESAQVDVGTYKSIIYKSVKEVEIADSQVQLPAYSSVILE